MNLITCSISSIQSEIDSGNFPVAVIGIGRIGLPTALMFGNSNFLTYGVDINKNLIDNIQNNIFPLSDEPGMIEIFENVLKNKKFFVSTDIKEILSKVSVVILSLPTPMNSENIPNYSSLISVGKQLHDFLQPNCLIIVESTVEPGFIENTLIPIIEGPEKKFSAGIDFLIGVCPETANPGEIINDFKNLPRLVGGINKQTSDLIIEIYSSVFDVELVLMPDCKTANAVKLTTNVFRDVNIAFVNQLALLFEKLEINILTVLEAANKKYNFQIHYPGPGVGGPCLPVNSYQFLNTEKSLNSNFLELVKIARKTNEKMPEHVLSLLSEAFNEINEKLESKTIAILGISYKPNVKDIQISPAETIINLLKQKNFIKIYDPFYINSHVYSIFTEKSLEDTLKNADAALIITGHDEFKKINPDLFNSLLRYPILVDCSRSIDLNLAKQSNLIFRGIGRGYKSINREKI